MRFKAVPPAAVGETESVCFTPNNHAPPPEKPRPSLPPHTGGRKICNALYFPWRFYTAIHNRRIRTHTQYMKVKKWAASHTWRSPMNPG